MVILSTFSVPVATFVHFQTTSYIQSMPKITPLFWPQNNATFFENLGPKILKIKKMRYILVNILVYFGILWYIFLVYSYLWLFSWFIVFKYWRKFQDIKEISHFFTFRPFLTILRNYQNKAYFFENLGPKNGPYFDNWVYCSSHYNLWVKNYRHVSVI